MADPTNIWGTYGESTGGAGTGGPEPAQNDPNGTYAQCNDIEPDAPPDDTRTLWVPLTDCLSGDDSQEWVPIDDETYPIGTVVRVSDITTIGDSSPCVYVSDHYRLSTLVPEFDFPQGEVICGGYPSCAECAAQCYKLTDCLSGSVIYSNTASLSAFAGGQTVIGGRCYTVATEADASNCCPDTDTDVTPAGAYVSCAECDQAINPSAAPCSCNDESKLISALNVQFTIQWWYCDESAPTVFATTSVNVNTNNNAPGFCYWYWSGEVPISFETPAPQSVTGNVTGVTVYGFETTAGGDCYWAVTVTYALDGYGSFSITRGMKAIGLTPPGTYGCEVTINGSATNVNCCNGFMADPTGCASWTSECDEGALFNPYVSEIGVS